MKPSCKYSLIALLLAVILTALSYAFYPPSPIIVGFSGQLEGQYADLGVQGRNGVQLCMEQINANGGIKGHELVLITRHDGETGADAVAADSELLKKGVVAIIGHMTSQQSVAALKAEALSGPDGIPYISPTTSTPALSGIKDNFFRVMSSNTTWAQALADHVIKHSPSRRFVSIYDTENESYTKSFTTEFSKQLTENGGLMLTSIPIQSSTNSSWDETIAIIRNEKADGLLLALSAHDVVSLTQNLYLQNIHLPLFSAPWAFTNALIQNGGKHVEGLTASITYNPDSTYPEFTLFKQQYTQRFGSTPTFAAAFGYEAMQTLAAALRITGGKPEKLLAALSSLGPQKGVIGPLELDEFGDINRPPFILTIKNSTMVNAN